MATRIPEVINEIKQVKTTFIEEEEEEEICSEQMRKI